MPDEIIELHGKHFGLCCFQYYSNWYDLEMLLNRFERITGKAILAGDGCFAILKEQMPDPYGPQCVNQEVRVNCFKEAFYNAFTRKDFVGWNWCGWLEYWQSYKEGKQHSGLQDPFGPQCPTGEERAECFRASLYNAFARIDFVGWEWCGWVDTWKDLRPLKQHGGFQDPFGQYDELLRQESKSFSNIMYTIALGGNSK